MNIQGICMAMIGSFLYLLTIGQTPVKAGIYKEIIPINTSKEHSWWNLIHYSISINPDYDKKFIRGSNTITFSARQTGSILQIDLQDPMIISSVTWNNIALTVTKRGKDQYLVSFPREIKQGETHKILVQFEGQPTESKKPPFDNGWMWAKDQKERPWISVACEGSGASIWLPCKEVLYDEPDKGVDFSITVPDSLSAVANGRLQKKISNNDGSTTFTWKVINPINNYNIIPYIGKYVSWHKGYNGVKGKLDCDFWVIDYNLNKGKSHFNQVDTMLRSFEYWLGPYPFYEDSYKLVEAPMPGMEHQSAVAYGNGFRNGYAGKDNISGTGWGLRWDFIMVHESGHEWFGNSITSSNHSDTWIHEGFTKYLETLYTDFAFGKQAGNEYTIGTWKRIKNDQQILGTSTSDKYYKGSAMLHTIRQILGDNIFRGWLKKLNQQFYHRSVNTAQILESLNAHTGSDFSKVFDQYLRTIKVPVLEYYFGKDKVNYRWTETVDGFVMPIKISLGDGKSRMIYPTQKWQQVDNSEINNRVLTVDPNFYVQASKFLINK